jgi:signal transduction histidine kinase
LTLRAKAILAFAAIALYLAAAAGAVSWQRSKLNHILEELESLQQVESTLARVNTFASQTLLKINEGIIGSEPRRIAESVAIDVESISAGLGGLGAWYPGAGAMGTRMDAALTAARATPERSGVLLLRSVILEASAVLDQISREVHASHESMWAGYRATYDSVTLLASLFFMLGLASFGTLSMVFVRRLARDLGMLSERAVEVVRGFRGAPLPVSRGDEVGALMDSVNRMQLILREREQQIEVTRQQRFHQEKMAAIGSLAAAVAHEINNPIAAIEGVAHTIGEARCGACAGAPGDCHPELILEHTRRIAAITRQLSQLTSPQSTEAEWTDLNAIARATCAFVGYDPRFRAITMDLALDASVPAAWAVGDHVTQVLMNLLINAADAFRGGTGSMRRIKVSTRADERHVHLAVEDNGPGMDREVAARAFEEGFTTKADGSGIGLFMCKTLVERDGGTIGLASQVGAGSRVTVSLPIQCT